MRKMALSAGVLYLITIIASIPALVLYGPVLNNPDYIVTSGTDTRMLWGGFREVITALACIGTAVVLFPVVKRQNEAAALGFVTARVFEAAVIVVGVISLLSVVTLRGRTWTELPEQMPPRWSPPAARSSRSTTGRFYSALASCRA